MPETPQPSSPAADLCQEDIARRAYELYRDGHSEDGHDIDHWLRAEHELRAAQEPRAVAKPDRRTGQLKTVRADKRASQAVDTVG